MFKENNSNFFSTRDIDLDEMIKAVKTHKELLDKIEIELQDDLEQLNSIVEFLQVIKDAEHKEIEIDDEITTRKITKLYIKSQEYLDILDISELNIDYRLTAELNFAIHCIFEALHDEVSHYVKDAEKAVNILKFLLDCR